MPLLLASWYTNPLMTLALGRSRPSRDSTWRRVILRPGEAGERGVVRATGELAFFDFRNQKRFMIGTPNVDHDAPTERCGGTARGSTAGTRAERRATGFCSHEGQWLKRSALAKLTTSSLL